MSASPIDLAIVGGGLAGSGAAERGAEHRRRQAAAVSVGDTLYMLESRSSHTVYHGEVLTDFKLANDSDNPSFFARDGVKQIDTNEPEGWDSTEEYICKVRWSKGTLSHNGKTKYLNDGFIAASIVPRTGEQGAGISEHFNLN